MFKLIKINGARTNVPDIITIETDGVAEYRAGCVYFLSEGSLGMEALSEDELKFIPIENVKANSGQKFVRGYMVNADMIFETEIYGDFNTVGIGDKLCGHADEDGHMDGVDSNYGMDVILIERNTVRVNRKVLVALKW